jgi:hypothetical protein
MRTGQDITNAQILAKGNDVYAGFTYGVNIKSSPSVYCLKSGASSWTSLRSMAQDPNRDGNGFHITVSNSGQLFAARSEGADGKDITVRSYNETTTYWDNVPSVGMGAAFRADCQDVSIAAGTDICYVAVQSGSDVVIWQWKRQQ